MRRRRDRRPRDDDEVASRASLEIPDHSAECLTHATPRATERGADTARRITDNPFGRARTRKSECWSFIPSLHTAAISAFRRRRAASTNAAALDDGESLAATRAARGEHTAPARGTHARTKTVHARTAAGLRLI